MRPEPAPLPVLRAAFESTGSGRWLMQTVVKLGLDRSFGFRLVLDLGDDRVRGGLQATEARLAAGEVDFIDTDWLSVARCRLAGLPVTAAVPYGAIFGGLVAPESGALHDLADLPGKRIGVVRRQDKNWLLLRAVCRAQHGFDPETACIPVEAGSKTALLQGLEGGELDGALLFWHQVPALAAGGKFSEVCDLLDLLPQLGVALVPSTFFVFRDDLVRDRPGLVRAFADAMQVAAEALRLDARAWQAASGQRDPCWRALRAKWLARIRTRWESAMAADLEHLAANLLGPDGAALPAGTLAAGFLLEKKS
jgi:NitT/TauT family transport system substrate-binding protein